jgi:hypothetical protein
LGDNVNDVQRDADGERRAEAFRRWQIVLMRMIGRWHRAKDTAICGT